jgi:hypothetical protein
VRRSSAVVRPSVGLSGGSIENPSATDLRPLEQSSDQVFYRCVMGEEAVFGRETCPAFVQRVILIGQ